MNPHVPSTRALTARRFAARALAFLALGIGACGSPNEVHADGRTVPAFTDETGGAAPGGSAATETAVLAGGCFWGVQGVFQHLKGVTRAVSGYAGGDGQTASYTAVSMGGTGHTESVQVSFDPRQISYAQLLQVYFSVAHDPTQLNRQGPDRGTQYRSAIFPASEAQARIARAYIAQLDKARVFDAPIVTRIEAGRSFHPAEAYHQDFLARNPNHPYILINDQPKITELRRLFPGLYRADPVLVGAARTRAE